MMSRSGYRLAVRPAGSHHTIGVLREHAACLRVCVVVSDLAVWLAVLLRCPVMGCGDANDLMVCVV